MKTRTSLVSNSSSTSFVLALKKDPVPFNGLPIPTAENFLHFVSDLEDEDNQILARNKRELLHYIDHVIRENTAWWDSDTKESYYQMKDLGNDLDDSWEIISVEISYHEPMIQYVMKLMQYAGAMKILQERG
jgi:hypothetical protein